MKWNHSRKGTIEGEIVGDDGTWLKIKLTKRLYMGSLHGWCGPGKIVAVRKRFVQPLEEREE